MSNYSALLDREEQPMTTSDGWTIRRAPSIILQPPTDDDLAAMAATPSHRHFTPSGERLTDIP
jgi:hypothetical protein